MDNVDIAVEIVERVNNRASLTHNVAENYCCLHRVIGKKPLCEARNYAECQFNYSQIRFGKTGKPYMPGCRKFRPDSNLVQLSADA